MPTGASLNAKTTSSGDDVGDLGDRTPLGPSGTASAFLNACEKAQEVSEELVSDAQQQHLPMLGSRTLNRLAILVGAAGWIPAGLATDLVVTVAGA